MNFIYILLTVLCTVYGQFVIKWQVSQAGTLPEPAFEKALFLLRLCLNPWIMSGLIAAFLASLFWMAALTKFDLSYAYPFMALSFVLVLLGSTWFFNEPLAWPKIIGMVCIVAGIIIGSQE